MAQEKDRQEREKAERLAAALRANLARRKAQARGRRAAAEDDPPPPSPQGAETAETPANAATAKLPLREPAIVPDDEPG